MNVGITISVHALSMSLTVHNHPLGCGLFSHVDVATPVFPDLQPWLAGTPARYLCQTVTVCGQCYRDYEDRLQILKLPSLYYRRARGDMIETRPTNSHKASTKLNRSRYSARLTPRQEATLTSSRKNAVI